MKNVGKGIIKLIVILALIAGAVYIGKEAAPLIKLGLDLDGGVSITYQAAKDNPTSEEMGDSVYKLQLKAQDYSTEAEVYQEGGNKINIDIPGVSDANGILEELGKPGTLYFVEGNLTWPLLATDSEIDDIENPDTATSSVLNSGRSTSYYSGGVKVGETNPEDLVSGPGVANSNETQQSAELPSETIAGYTNTESVAPTTNPAVDNILGDNVHIEGADVIQNPDGSIQIGGTAQEGATVIQQGTPTAGTEEIPNYDYTKPPIFSEDQIVVSGNDITSARGGMYSDSYGQTQYVVDLAFTDEGKQKFAEATERNLGQPIYIIYNGEIVSAPTVQSVISEGRAQITGMESLETAERLASTIRIGALKLELEVLRSNVVGAKLGQDAISTSLKAGLIGFAIICLFMILVYRLPGLAASLALTMYVGLTLFFIQSFNITLTLPGIAGIILSIGMAVDANVIIFTRIKEEIGAGKNTRTAVKEGYNKALSAILDGNITTLIAAFVLNWKGTGSIKGFAATLALGIVLSMFTALFVTRFIMRAMLDLGLDNEVLYGKKVDNKIVDFVGFRKISYAISLILIVVGIAFIGINASKGNGGFNYGLDFKGGSSTSVEFNEDLSLADIDSRVVPIFENITNSSDIQTQKVANSNQVIIKSRTLTLEEMKTLYETLESSFGIPEEKITTENISGAVSVQMRRDAIVAVIISTILMLIYIWFRFKDIRFAGSAVIALLHDCLVTIGFYAVFRWTVDSTFIACMLTIVGYSINATIVIFDRIRENLGRLRGTSLENIVNTSVTQTFTRSINTSLTTLIMVVVLYVLGVNSIKAFALPLIIGIICGGYSSICITGPLWYDFKNAGKKSEDKNATAKKK
ncbi:MAG: protein translocase subunit SecD [Lachnospiraceae bacterium]|nr:protein translocase subunit SecD [Lachnospiraceae bacterium]